MAVPARMHDKSVSLRPPCRRGRRGAPGAVHDGRVDHLLLVEDDDAVRSLASRILERYGYAVLQARHGREALEQARRHPDGIDLLLTDVVMPELGGRRLAEQLQAHRPELRVLFMSGYTAGEIDRRGELDPGVAFLAKPFSAQSLLTKVREAVGA